MTPCDHFDTLDLYLQWCILINTYPRQCKSRVLSRLQGARKKFLRAPHPPDYRVSQNELPSWLMFHLYSLPHENEQSLTPGLFQTMPSGTGLLWYMDLSSGGNLGSTNRFPDDKSIYQSKPVPDGIVWKRPGVRKRLFIFMWQ